MASRKSVGDRRWKSAGDDNPEPFSVDVLFWEDLLAHLTADPSAVRRFWPGEAEAMLVARPDATVPSDGELRYLRSELERVAKWGEQLNVLSYYYRQTGPVPPREYSETVGSAEFEALWARVSLRSVLDEYLRTTINDVRDALRAWDKEAADFARSARSGALSERGLLEQDQSARTYGIRMQNNASSAIRTLDARLGPRSS